MRDYSTMDNVIKREFQDIRHSVSPKKSEALQNMNAFLLLAACMSLSAIRKSQSKQVQLYHEFGSNVTGLFARGTGVFY
jgi:hypothetical protein